jgi:hypothetical protein
MGVYQAWRTTNPNWRHGTGAGYNCSNGSWQVQLLHAQNTPNELERYNCRLQHTVTTAKTLLWL